MENGELNPVVLGVGHLAAAARVQLRAFGLVPSGSADCSANAPHLLLACSDYANASSFADLNRRAVGQRTRVLFAHLAGERVRVGPLVIPFESPCFECYLARRWDFSLGDNVCRFVTREACPTFELQNRARVMAQFGAVVVAREVWGIRFGARCGQLIGRVAENDPPSSEVRVVPVERVAGCGVCGNRQRGFSARFASCSAPGWAAAVRGGLFEIGGGPE